MAGRGWRVQRLLDRSRRISAAPRSRLSNAVAAAPACSGWRCGCRLRLARPPGPLRRPQPAAASARTGRRPRGTVAGLCAAWRLGRRSRARPTRDAGRRCAAPRVRRGRPPRHRPFDGETHPLPHSMANAGIRLVAGERTLAYTGDTGPDRRLVLTHLLPGTDQESARAAAAASFLRPYRRGRARPRHRPVTRSCCAVSHRQRRRCTVAGCRV